MGGGAALGSGPVSANHPGSTTTAAIQKAHDSGVADPAKIRQRIADSVALSLLDQQDAEAAVIDAQRERIAAVARDEAIARKAKAERDARRAEIMARYAP